MKPVAPNLFNNPEAADGICASATRTAPLQGVIEQFPSAVFFKETHYGTCTDKSKPSEWTPAEIKALAEQLTASA
jgi:hypothetical protein